jgi:hypothetical protein
MDNLEINSRGVYTYKRIKLALQLDYGNYHDAFL